MADMESIPHAASEQRRRRRGVVDRLRKLAWLLARPVRRGRRERELVIQPYRGFGSRDRLFLMGRVLWQPRALSPRDRFTRDLLDVARRLFRRGVAGMAVEARINGLRAATETDRDGYFRLDVDLSSQPLSEGGWHHADLALVDHPEIVVMARTLVHRPESRCLIVSDIDDTVVETGVANRLVMLWRLFAKGPHDRLPVPGIADFYRALNAGAGGAEHNPVVFVSRAPWTIYETLDAFLRIQRMPRDAVLFLREWGVRWYRPFARKDPNHKAELIRRVLRAAPALPAVLVGDSGQEDAEVYARIVGEFPGRIRCVLIRDLARSPTRSAAISALAHRLQAVGATLVLTPSAADMAKVTGELGLISVAAAGDIAEAVA